MDSGLSAHARHAQDELFLDAWTRALPELRRRARRLANGHADRADDLVADTAIKALVFVRKSPQGLTDLHGLLLVALRHVFLDDVRRRKRESQVLSTEADVRDGVEEAGSGEPTAPQRAELQEQMAHVMAAIAALSREQRRLFALRFIDELPYPVIAGRLHIGEPLLRKRIQLLRRRLRATLDRHESTPAAFVRARPA